MEQCADCGTELSPDYPSQSTPQKVAIKKTSRPVFSCCPYCREAFTRTEGHK